jgi:hypothetical protein
MEECCLLIDGFVHRDMEEEKKTREEALTKALAEERTVVARMEEELRKEKARSEEALSKAMTDKQEVETMKLQIDQLNEFVLSFFGAMLFVELLLCCCEIAGNWLLLWLARKRVKWLWLRKSDVLKKEASKCKVN